MKSSIMNSAACIILFLILANSILPQTNIPGGNVSGMWNSADSPFTIEGNIFIPADSTLTIEAGTEIIFNGYYELLVNGRLLALGTQTDSVKFTVSDTTGFSIPDTTLGSWNGIRFADIPEASDSSKLIYCDISFAKAVSDDHIESCGGGIFISDFDKILIADCKFSNCEVYGSDSPSGGAIYCSNSDIQLLRNEFINNKALDGGAILFWDCSPTIQQNFFTSNNAGGAGGAVWIGGNSSIFFDNDTFSNNRSANNGGAVIAWPGTNSHFIGVLFENNFSNWGAGAGSIGCEMNFIDCDFNSNGADWLGGALAADFSKITISRTSFYADTSGDMSGAIHGWHTNFDISESEFESNKANFGGAIHSDFCTLNIFDTEFLGNNGINGGAIHLFNSDLNLENSNLLNNEAENDGGAIQFHVDTTEYTKPFTLNILQSNFNENTAFRRAALEIVQYNSDSSLVNVLIDGCILENNSIDRGGNLLISGSIKDFTISNSIIKNNTAVLRTSGLSLSGNCKGEIINCLFRGNLTGGGSSALAIGIGAKVDILNSTFADNNGSMGSALSLRNNGHVNLMNNILWNNLPYNINITSVTDSTPCSMNAFNNNIEFGIDSVVVNDSVSIINWGTGNIDSDPLFVDQLNGDYHLQTASPCINAGADSVYMSDHWCICPLVDIEGNLRPDPAGTNPDIGAYESAEPIVKVEEEKIPIEFSLMQNYPNPFNPSTTIKYSIPIIVGDENGGLVTLEVFDILGKKVATLVNENMRSGNYEIEFNAADLPSGVYFYRLEAGDPALSTVQVFTETKKMILIK